MKELGLQSFVRVRRYRSYKGNYGKVAPNILKRDFKADKPNSKWVTDVTQFNVLDTKIYLSPIVDLFNGEVISYNISESPNFHQIEDMLDKAFIRISDNTNLILHSDQGWQYQMQGYHKMLEEKGIQQSMSRKGNCLDNSPMENFFGKMKNEMFYGYEYTFETLDDLKIAMEEYIEYYNTQRITVKLKGLTPVQYREQSLLTA